MRSLLVSVRRKVKRCAELRLGLRHLNNAASSLPALTLRLADSPQTARRTDAAEQTGLSAEATVPPNTGGGKRKSKPRPVFIWAQQSLTNACLPGLRRADSSLIGRVTEHQRLSPGPRDYRAQPGASPLPPSRRFPLDLNLQSQPEDSPDYSPTFHPLGIRSQLPARPRGTPTFRDRWLSAAGGSGAATSAEGCCALAARGNLGMGSPSRLGEGPEGEGSGGGGSGGPVRV